MSIIRLTCFLLLIACYTCPAQAQVLTWKKGQRDLRESLPQELKQPRAWEVPVKLVLTPAAEPSPALKYRFGIPLDQRQPGNVESNVSLAIIMYLQNPLRSKLDSQYVEIVQALPEPDNGTVIPSEALRNQVRDYLDSHADVLKQLHYALRLDALDSNYAVSDMHGSDAHDANVAIAQNHRALAWLLQLECSLAIAEGRFDDAVGALQSGYRLAEVALLGDHETVITQLVSLAIFGMISSEVQTIIQLPNTPNMYWALASVPQKELFSPRAAMERAMLENSRRLFPRSIKDIDQASESQSEIKLIELVANVQAASHGNHREFVPPPGQNRLIAALAVAMLSDRARSEIKDADAGNCQALLKWTTVSFQAAIEEAFKWSILPLELRLSRADLIDDWLASFQGVPDSPGGALATLVLPAVQAFDSAVARNQRHHALLITLEALRAYAAENSGALPETLDKLTPLPAWTDTSTGKPFEYHRIDQHHAVIHIEKSLGVPSEYHIELRP